MVLVRHEAGAFSQTARRVRRKLVRGVDEIEAKLDRSRDSLRRGARRDRGHRARRGRGAPLRAEGKRHAGPGAPDARARAVDGDVVPAGASLRRRGAACCSASRARLRLDAGHPHLSRRIGAGEPGLSCRRPSPTCSAPTRSISSTATSPPTLRSRSTTPRWAGTATTGTWARRSTIWRSRTRCAPSAWAISAISRPIPSPTTTSCPASSCSPAAPPRWGTRTGRPGSKRTWATRTPGRPRT